MLGPTVSNSKGGSGGNFWSPMQDHAALWHDKVCFMRGVQSTGSNHYIYLGIARLEDSQGFSGTSNFWSLECGRISVRNIHHEVLTPCKTTQHCGLHRWAWVGWYHCIVTITAWQSVIGPNFAQLNPGLGMQAVSLVNPKILFWSALARN